MDNVFEWLQQWYRSQCNGDWEHSFGISIDTVDNPGWYIVINLSDTEYENYSFSPVKLERGEMDWYFCLLRENNFEASCGPNNLGEVFQIFRNWIELSQKQQST